MGNILMDTYVNNNLWQIFIYKFMGNVQFYSPSLHALGSPLLWKVINYVNSDNQS